MPTTAERPWVRFLGHGAERSGPPIYLLRLLRWWNRTPPPFDIEVVLGRPGPLVDAYRQVASTRVARLDRRSPERLAERALAATAPEAWGARVVEAATRHRVESGCQPSVTVVNGATAATAQLLRTLGPKAPVVVIAHELSTGWFHNIDAEARQLLLKADRFLAVSRCVERFLIDRLGVPPDRVTMAPPVVDSSEAAPTPERHDSRIVVGGGGMTDWRKAPELWLSVAHHARRLAPELPLHFRWFGGDAPGTAAFWPLGHEIDHLGLSDVVEFLGDVEEPGRVIADLDVFVSTAREDAYPLVCAESALAGIPLVAFDGGGAAELIQDAACGYVVDYPDIVGAAQRVVDLASDADHRVAIGARGRAFALGHLDVAAVASTIERWVLAGPAA